MVAAAVFGFREWSYRADLSRAERALAAGDARGAREILARLSGRWPGRDEVEYPLGVAEANLGRVDAALGAWGRVSVSSPAGVTAALRRARLAIEHGRLALAEESLGGLADRPGEVGDEAARLADRLDLYSGRAAGIVRRVERRWRSSGDQTARLKTHWLYDTQPLPLAAVREALGRFAKEAPEDDRVWLGRADLATRTGRLDEADDLLRRCEARRPADVDVLRARLAWALDAGRVEAFRSAASALPAERFTAAEVAGYSARLAALGTDREAERAALRQWSAVEPGEASTWKRLAELSAGEEAAGDRHRKAEVDRALDDYRRRMGGVTPGATAVDHAALARTAEALGRRFEGAGWWSLRLLQTLDDAEARAGLDRLSRDPDRQFSTANRGRTLASLLGLTKGPVAKTEGPAPALAIPQFRDDAGAAGLRFRYENDRSPPRRLPETMGGGIGLLDYDGDGLLDVYAAQGGRFPDGDARSGGGDRLFRNLGGGRFADETERAGVAGLPRGFGHGVAVGDVDGDGRPDLFVTRWRRYALLRNRGDGTFEDATARYGLGGDRGWPTSAALADLDGDGDLDLYVCHYLRWSPETSPPCPNPERPGENLYCVPLAFESEPDHVFRNDGGRFVDVTAESGVRDDQGRGLGVVAADLDGDGRVDLYVANDMTANYLFRSLGGFRFESAGEASGVGSNAQGGYQAGMGVACGDLDGDGRPDLAVTNFFGESTTLFQNLGDGLFADRTAALGLAAPSRYVLGFGAAFADLNDDGRLDLVTANGHVNDFRPATPYAMPAQLFLGLGGGRLVDVSARAGPCWEVERVARGLAVGDLDNDGRLDALLLDQAAPLAAFRNLGTPAGAPKPHSLTVRLRGRSANRDGVGALVRVTSAGRTQVAQRLGGGSFLSASDGRLHFGLGTEPDQAPVVEVHWPGGRVDRHDRLRPDSFSLLIEGDDQPHDDHGWKADP